MSSGGQCTTLVVVQESQIHDCWNVDGDQRYQGGGCVFTKFTLSHKQFEWDTRCPGRGNNDSSNIQARLCNAKGFVEHVVEVIKMK